MPLANLDGIERWFVARGLPHFVERHESPSLIWSRALPLLIPAYVLLGLNALDLRNWSLQRNLLVAGFVVASLVVTWVLANRLRGRPALDRPTRIGRAELAVFVIAPALPSLVFGQWRDVVEAVLEAIAVLAVLWALTSYGVFPLLRWVGKRTLTQLALLLGVVVRALPLLLLFTAFLFITEEVWQVAGTLTGVLYVALVGIFFLLGAFFVLSQIPSLMRELNRFDSWAEVGDLVVGTPAASVLPELDVDPRQPPTVTKPNVRQRFNIGLFTIFSQAIQVTLVGLALTGFYILFGFLAVPEATVERWSTLDSVNVLADVTVGDRVLVITEPLIRVAVFLGAFTAMYFTVLLSTDATYRSEFAEDVGPELRQAFAVRCVYRRARGWL